MNPTWLIMSGAFVDQELAAEFGRLPPSFLPVGNKRLYEHQRACIKSKHAFITLPEEYSPPAVDIERIGKLGMEIVTIPSGLSLGSAIVYAVNLIGEIRSVRILYGDTLVLDEDLNTIDDDAIGLGSTSQAYSWASAEIDEGRVRSIRTHEAGTDTEYDWPIVAGLFAFSSGTALVRSLTRAQGRFDTGITDYVQRTPVRGLMLTKWYDFGHVHTYFQSRRIVSTERAFNSLTFKDGAVEKASFDVSKIRAEIHWLKKLPPTLRTSAARLLASGGERNGRESYATEYEFLPPLSELYVFGEIQRRGWRVILNSCCEFLTQCAALPDPNRTLDASAILNLGPAKTERRLEEYAKTSKFNIDAPNVLNGKNLPSLRSIASRLSKSCAVDPSFNTIMHGDFCLSNILFDSRAQRIRVLDPRGYVVPDKPSLYGDRRYDLAKLSHSIMGRYDHIIAGRYSLTRLGANEFALSFDVSDTQKWLESSGADIAVGGISLEDECVWALEVGLFLSMLPLHSDRPDRQNAFVANALRLYAEFESRFG